MSDPQSPQEPEVPAEQQAWQPDVEAPPAQTAWQPAEPVAEQPVQPAPPVEQPLQPEQLAQPAQSTLGDAQQAPPAWQPSAPTQSWQPGYAAASGASDKRPGVVTAGVIILWGVALLNIALLLASLGALQAYGSAALTEAMPAVMFSVVTSLAIAAIAFFAWQRANWARIALAIVVGLTIIISISSGGGAGLFAIVGVVLLFLPPANAWFKRA